MALSRRLTTVSKTRFSSLEWATIAEKTKISIVGLGGIGSWVALAAARAGYRMTIYDFDRLEPINFAGQAYRVNDIGLDKVTAVDNMLRTFCITPALDGIWTQRVDESTTLNSVVLSCLDSMTARKHVYAAWKRAAMHTLNGNQPKLLIDGRLLAEQFQVYFVTPDNLSQYEATLFDDSEVGEDSCTNRQTSHYAMLIAGTMVKGLNNYMQNFALRNDERVVPFSVEDEGFLFTQNVEVCVASPISST